MNDPVNRTDTGRGASRSMRSTWWSSDHVSRIDEAGGDLIQDVPDPKHHMATKESGDAIHAVRAQHNLMREFYGEEFPVNSAHHQAAGKLGAGLIPLCVSDDGINEGFIHENGKVIGVQFHPERIGFAHRRPDAVDGEKLFLMACRCHYGIREGTRGDEIDPEII